MASLLSIFRSMETNDDFAEDTSAYLADLISSAVVTTTDAGTVSAGTFVGVGAGTVSVQSSLLEAHLKAACTSMDSLTEGGDTVLAQAFASGCAAMMAAATIDITVTGTATNPSTGVTVTVSGSSTGVWAGSESSIYSGLISCFNTMYGMTTGGGDEYFAAQLEALVRAYVNAGAVTSTGSGAVAGAFGTGVASC